MTTIAALDLATGQFRRAVASGSHAEAGVYLEAYSQALDAHLRMLQPGDPTTDQLRTDALQLIEWARRTTLATRAHYSRQLATLPDLRRYAAPAVTLRTYDTLI
jgi:hypothetical protein